MPNLPTAATWEPLGWFVPVVTTLTILGIILALSKIQRFRAFLTIVLPWLLGSVVLGMGFVTWNLEQQVLVTVFAQVGLHAPPFSLFYMIVGAMGVLPMIAVVTHALWHRRLERRATR